MKRGFAGALALVGELVRRDMNLGCGIRGELGAAIDLVDGLGDLGRQMRRALGEQQRWLGARDDGEKHGRLRVGAVQPTRAMCLQAFTDFL